MKKASKIIIIITMIYVAVMTVLSLCSLCALPLFDLGTAGGIFFATYIISYAATMVVLCIPTFIVGFIALAKLKQPGKPSVAISVLTLLFCNIVAGILMLCTPQNSN